MRHQTREIAEKLIKEYGPFEKVLDVGSLASSGGTLKDLFEKTDYKGIDMRDGENVDIVVNGHNLHDVFDDETFDLVICVDTFEHDDAFWLTLEQCKRVLKKGGILFLGVPARFHPEHNHPNDYWRFMPQSMELMLDGLEVLGIDVQKDNPEHFAEDEIYGWGKKI